MRVSVKSEYALRIMADLALNRLTPVSVADISSRQNISAKYAEQIMAILKRAGFVESKRGALGGYRLCVSAENCRVGDVVRLMEGRIPIGGGITARLKDEIAKAVDEVLDRYTIADLIRN